MDGYEQQLAEWMARMGVGREVIVGSVEHADAEDIALRVADKKSRGEDYCVVCGEGPQAIAGMELITRRDDPYIQPEEGLIDEEDDADDADGALEVAMRVRACPRCWAVEYGPEADEEAPANGRE